MTTMPSTITGENIIMYRFGDIILLPLPYTDLRTVKTRPAIVVCSAPYQVSYPDLVVCYVSSQTGAADKPLDHVIQKWKEAGLLKPSFLRPKLATIDATLIVLQIGALAEVDRVSLEQILCRALGLTCPLKQTPPVSADSRPAQATTVGDSSPGVKKPDGFVITKPSGHETQVVSSTFSAHRLIFSR